MLDPKMKVEQLDIRGYFAAMAMQGLLTNPLAGNDYPLNQIAEMAISYADALIAELNNP